MNRIPSLIKIIVACLSAFLCVCSSSPLAGGNSSQTGNSGIAVISRSQSIFGATVPGARVSIYDQGFRPYLTPSGFSDSAVATDSGRFSFSPVAEGHYNLLVVDVRHGGAAFVANIPVFPDSVFADTLDTLRQPGFINGTAADTAGSTYALSYIFIDGSPFYTVTKNNGDFLLGPLPEGTYATGLFANFQVADARTGVIAQMAGLRTDTTVITVVSDSVSTWHW